MAKYKVCYEGWYIIEAENIGEAMDTDRDDAKVEYEEWENTVVWEMEGFDG